jgi:flavin-dependent dehydrogenase
MYVDVIIIGAGPAGCAAAITCSNAGLSTLIITNRNEQEIPVTNEPQPSESIHPGVESLLTKINAAHAIKLAETGIYEGVQTGNQFSPLGSSAEEGTWYGTHINRNVFDATLLQTALQQGVSILWNDAVRSFIHQQDWVAGVITASGTEIPAKYVIDASGYKRIAGKKLHFKEIFFSPPLVAWTGISKVSDPASPIFQNAFTKFIPSPTGWAWLAPEPPNYCTWTRLASKGKQTFLPPAELKQFEQTGAVKIYNRRWSIFRPVCKEGIILCGDAAAIIDPAAGQGILNALLTGIESAKTVILCMLNPDEEASYLIHYDNWLLKLYTDKVEKLKNYYVENGIGIL